MRVVFAVLCVLMILAALVQYNDPDGPIWMVIYGVAAIWTGIAAFRPERLSGPTSRALLLISVATAVILTVILWPPVGGWWRNQVWSMDVAADTDAGRIAEQAREGMGIMIVTAVLLAVAVRSLAMRARASTSSRGAVGELG
jgi:hypothetical protein